MVVIDLIRLKHPMFSWFSNIVLEERSAIVQDKEVVLVHASAGYEGRGTLCAGDCALEASRLVRGDGEETLLLKMFSPALHIVLEFENIGVLNGSV